MNQILRDAREERGKTQAWVAKAAGISETHYQNIEYGKADPNVQAAIRIAKALGSTVEKLFTPEEPLTEEDKARLEYRTRLKAEMAKILAGRK